MSQSKFAILVDSCSDVPQNIIEKENIYVVPIHLHYKNTDYLDKIDISPTEVYEKMPEDIPTTSQPSVGEIVKVLNQIADDGYETVFAIAISSGLSGTYNSMRIAANEEKRLKVIPIDTLNIGIGAGASAIYAAQLIREKLSESEILEKLRHSIAEAKVYFSVATLEYLKKGGRIGKVAAAFGSLLRINPVITCDEEGKYIVASKARGRSRSLKEVVDLAFKYAKKYVNFYVMVSHGNAKEEAQKILDELKLLLPNATNFFMTDLSPALGVHTGPGMVGAGIYPIDL
ncbi:MAG: DegV family protein [Eubacteriales bacterium]|nr:DegV family protein [Eubacteriales bacterium]